MPPPITTSEQLAIDSRRQQVAVLRKAGASIASIAMQLQCSESTVSADIKIMLNALHRDQKLNIDEYRQLELERLDQMQVAIWQKATNGDTNAQRSILRIMEHRAKLLGLYMAPNFDPRLSQAIAKALALQGIDPNIFLQNVLDELQSEQLFKPPAALPPLNVTPDAPPSDPAITFDS